MKKLAVTLLLCFVMLTPATLGLRGVARGQRVVTAQQVNGTWRTRSGIFEVRALGRQKLKVEFSGFWQYDTWQYDARDGPMVNTGTGRGVAHIEGDTAVFVPEGVEEYDERCRITMRFTRGRLVVTQDGVCGIGYNVSAAGTYRRVNRRPKFGEF